MSDQPANRAFVALGSNIQARVNLQRAVERLSALGRIVRISRVLETEPIGFADQPRFLNAALLLETPFTAARLVTESLWAVEAQLGRDRDPKNTSGPRTIDLDLSLFNNDVGIFGDHRIPDPDILDRAFLAVNLADLDPEYVHPEVQRTLPDIAADLCLHTDPGIVRGDIQLI